MRARLIAAAAALAVAATWAISAFSQTQTPTALPPGTVLDPPRTTQPRQMLRSEIAGGPGGAQSGGGADWCCCS